MLTIPQYAKAIGKNRQFVYRAVKSGKIRAKRVGRGFIVTQRPRKLSNRKGQG